jgi:hypothetical protein
VCAKGLYIRSLLVIALCHRHTSSATSNIPYLAYHSAQLSVPTRATSDSMEGELFSRKFQAWSSNFNSKRGEISRYVLRARHVPVVNSFLVTLPRTHMSEGKEEQHTWVVTYLRGQTRLYLKSRLLLGIELFITIHRCTRTDILRYPKSSKQETYTGTKTVVLVY